VGRELASVTEIEQIKMKIHDYISKHTWVNVITVTQLHHHIISSL
jgi:hypothetical protein